MHLKYGRPAFPLRFERRVMFFRMEVLLHLQHVVGAGAIGEGRDFVDLFSRAVKDVEGLPSDLVNFRR